MRFKMNEKYVEEFVYIEEYTKTFMPLANFNNGFFLYVINTFLNKNYTFLIIYGKVQKLESYQNTNLLTQHFCISDVVVAEKV